MTNVIALRVYKSNGNDIHARVFEIQPDSSGNGFRCEIEVEWGLGKIEAYYGSGFDRLEALLNAIFILDVIVDELNRTEFANSMYATNKNDLGIHIASRFRENHSASRENP